MAANEALLAIAEVVGASEEERELVITWIERGRRALSECWDPELKLCLDYDARIGKPLRARTVAGFAPLVAGGLSAERRKALLGILYSSTFAGHPRLRWTLPPSTSPEDPGFHRRNYWRVPV